MFRAVTAGDGGSDEETSWQPGESGKCRLAGRCGTSDSDPDDKDKDKDDDDDDDEDEDEEDRECEGKSKSSARGTKISGALASCTRHSPSSSVAHTSWHASNARGWK